MLKLRQSRWKAMIRPCTLYLFLSLLVCMPSPSQTKLSAQDHQRLMSYINTYNSMKLLADPLVQPQLAHLMGAQISHLKRNLNVAGPIGVSSEMLTFSGNAPHQGMEENGFLGVSLYNGEVYACLLTKGKFEVYGKEKQYNFLPDAVRQWIEATWARLQLGIKDPPNVVLHPAR